MLTSSTVGIYAVAQYYLQAPVVLVVQLFQMLQLLHEILVVPYYHPYLEIHLVQVAHLVLVVREILVVPQVHWRQSLQEDLGDLIGLAFRVIQGVPVDCHVGQRILCHLVDRPVLRIQSSLVVQVVLVFPICREVLSTHHYVNISLQQSTAQHWT